MPASISRKLSSARKHVLQILWQYRSWMQKHTLVMMCSLWYYVKLVLKSQFVRQPIFCLGYDSEDGLNSNGMYWREGRMDRFGTNVWLQLRSRSKEFIPKCENWCRNLLLLPMQHISQVVRHPKPQSPAQLLRQHHLAFLQLPAMVPTFHHRYKVSRNTIWVSPS